MKPHIENNLNFIPLLLFKFSEMTERVIKYRATQQNELKCYVVVAVVTILWQYIVNLNAASLLYSLILIANFEVSAFCLLTFFILPTPDIGMCPFLATLQQPHNIYFLNIYLFIKS